MDNDASRAAAEAADELRSQTGVDRYDFAAVMGSGWGAMAEALGVPDQEIETARLPGFRAPTALGHGGRVLSLTVGAKKALVFLGRTHLYEGHGEAAVAHGVRTAVSAGAETVVLTNAAGALRPDLQVGQPVLISDHINLTGKSPLVGANFVDLTDAYSAELRALATEVEPTLAQGVYAALPGPHFETPAEIRMLRTLGADLVGMSTALEAIAAREYGARVLAISLVTNVAAGLSGQPLNHQEVLEAGRASATRVGDLLARVAARL
ncbi:purine-nucleoside phosphorylase [Allonocardiopsis opalescens]|uniref:Purine nucleoside phosphorylase n=1 Tax=Allonocardiopsis opalescens TaxID=1144618 RepID=A0A2T0PSW7_9ACTN|nr:purine-nucleoside phosphorylase [Allonocardiopsis opalescens]PRX91826.1 purine-nucleoside phosphorylase [Allonocardiopsis opalescens]